jgi:hypothetical protein
MGQVAIKHDEKDKIFATRGASPTPFIRFPSSGSLRQVPFDRLRERKRWRNSEFTYMPADDHPLIGVFFLRD